MEYFIFIFFRDVLSKIRDFIKELSFSVIQIWMHKNSVDLKIYIKHANFKIIIFSWRKYVLRIC